MVFAGRFFAATAGLVILLATPAYAQQAKQPADKLTGPPFVTCRAWAIVDAKTGKLLWGENETKPLPMASTTKIMTAWLVLQLAEKDAKVLDETLTVSKKADRTSGSTAGIRTGEKFIVRDVLYGLLLPSGNDAAVALAEHFGGRFPPSEKKKDASDEDRFVAQMNREAAALGMKNTRYSNPHGNGGIRSSTHDLLKLAFKGMQNATFQKYVKTRYHRGTAVKTDGGKRIAEWRNTNRLLGIEGYDGIKTGTTGAARACLVSSGRRGKDHILMAILGSSSTDARYVDSRNLYRWAWRQRGHE